MTTTTGGIDDRDDRTTTAADGEGGVADEPVGAAMRFTVMDRHADRVHLVSVEADTGILYGHPSVCEEAWQQALREVPANWEIVDLCPQERIAVDPPESVCAALDEFAARKYDLFLAFLGAGFERCEALTLVIETLRADDGD